jgi:hypothetical protein
VTKIELSFPDELRGTLPPASVFKGLTALTVISLGSTSVTGTLPSDWGTLAQLEDIRIIFHPRITGPLPDSWAGLTRLKVLHLL